MLENSQNSINSKCQAFGSKFGNPLLIQNDCGTPGSLGCIVHSSKLNKPVFLSTYHLLFENFEFHNIWWKRNGTSNKGKLLGTSFIGKIGYKEYQGSQYFIDCAIGQFSNNFQLSEFNSSPSGTEVQGSIMAKTGDLVFKQGATSGLTEGKIIDTKYNSICKINGKIYSVVNQLLIKAFYGLNFSEKGDSGSLILNFNREAVGLLWGATNLGEGIACPIHPLINELNISFDLKYEVKKNIPNGTHPNNLNLN